MEIFLVIFIFFALILLELGVLIILYLRSKKVVKSIDLLNDEMNSINSQIIKDNSSKTKRNIKTQLKEYKGKVPPLKDDEELIFIKDMNIDRKEKFIEMNIDVDRKK